jgi:hypothetical protein
VPIPGIEKIGFLLESKGATAISMVAVVLSAWPSAIFLP